MRRLPSERIQRSVAAPSRGARIRGRVDGFGVVAARARYGRPDEDPELDVAAVRRQADGGSDRLSEHQASMNKRPVLVLLTSSWISMLGAALVTLAGFSWLFVLPLNITGRVNNPYIGLLVFIA